MDRNEMKAAVRDLLLMEVDRQLEGKRPDHLMECYDRATSYELLAWKAREAEMVVNQLTHLQAWDAYRLKLARRLYAKVAAQPLRFHLGLLPSNLRKWADKVLAKAKASGDRKLANLARVYVYLTLKDAVEWELDQLAPVPDQLQVEGERLWHAPEEPEEYNSTQHEFSTVSAVGEDRGFYRDRSFC